MISMASGCGDGRCPLIPTSRAPILPETADQAGDRVRSAHTSTIRRVAVNYPELDGMYDNLTIRCQTLEEILADKLISFSATDTHIRHRDLWDIPWIVRAQEIDFSAVAALVGRKHSTTAAPPPCQLIAVGVQRAHVCYADGSFRTDAAFPIPCRLEPRTFR